MASPTSAVLSRPHLPTAIQGRRDVFAAIDFETADFRRDSACQVAVVRVENGVITARAVHLIRPPRKAFQFTNIHGIRWEDVADEPSFADVWPRVAPLLEGVHTVYAHNAPFDRSVLEACCAAAGLRPPSVLWACTVKLAKETWGMRGNQLPEVCGRLNIALNHHDAASDAEACAQIVLAARATGR